MRNACPSQSQEISEFRVDALGVGFDVNLTTCSTGLPPLVYAAFKGHEASVRLLLAGAPGINVNHDNSTDGITPLYRGARGSRNMRTTIAGRTSDQRQPSRDR